MAGRGKPLPDNVVSIDGKQLTVVELDKAQRRRITAAAKERYLVLLEEGMSGNEAAHELGLTGSRMRSEAKRDEEFGKQVDAAKGKGRPGLVDRIQAAYVNRALDPDGPPQLLHNLAIVYHPDWDVFRKLKLEGGLDLRAMPAIDVALYSDEELEQLRDLLQRKPPELTP